MVRPLHKTVIRTETTISKVSSHKHAHVLPQPKPVIHPKPKIGHKPAVLPKDMMPVGPMMTGGPMMGGEPLMGGGPMMVDAPMMAPGPHDGIMHPIVDGELPPEIRKLIGSTISGKAIIGGQGRFPEHGGAGAGPAFANGKRQGWGGQGRPETRPVAVTAWEHPLGGQPWDPNYNGEAPLVFDPNRGMYVARHHQAKKTGAMMGGPSAVAGHNIVKEANHIAEKTIAGVGLGAPLIGKPTGPGSYIGLSDIETMGMVGPVAMEHQIAKSSGIGPARHSIAKATAGMQHNMGKARMLEIDPYGNPVGDIQHGIAKSQVMGGMGDMVGMGSVGMQHDIAKSQTMIGVGGLGGGAIQHDIAKSQVMGAGVPHVVAKASASIGAVDPFGGPIGGVGDIHHNIAKATSGVGSPIGPVGMGGPMLPPIQVKKAGGNPVHNVEKVIQSGVASVNHDNLAFEIGSNIARQLVHNSAQTIDMGTGGAVSGGSVIAQRATHGLAKEAAHIATETLDIASGKRGHLGAHAVVGDTIVGATGPMMAGGPGAMMAGSGGVGMQLGPAVMPMHMDPVLPGKPVLPKKPKYEGGLGTIVGGGAIMGVPGVHPIQPMMEPIIPMEPMMPVLPKKPKVPKYKKGGYSRNPGRRRGWKKGKKGKKGRRRFKGMKMSKLM